MRIHEGNLNVYYQVTEDSFEKAIYTLWFQLYDNLEESKVGRW